MTLKWDYARVAAALSLLNSASGQLGDKSVSAPAVRVVAGGRRTGRSAPPGGILTLVPRRVVDFGSFIESG